jgi:flagellar hook protein FlgE
MDLSAVALQGLDRAQVALENVATQLASTSTLSADSASTDTVDLSSEMVALLSAKNVFSANLATLKVADQLQKSVIDLMA